MREPARARRVPGTGRGLTHREITAKGYRLMRPGIELAPWNARVMEVIDPFGNRLRFNEPVEQGAAP